jgi:hypothetical protein
MHFKSESSACALVATLACSFLVFPGCGPAASEEVSAGAAERLARREDAVLSTLSTSYSFSASNTNNAQQNTVDQVIAFNEGDTVEVGTCGVTGAAGTDDTYLRMKDSTGAEVAFNDDGCGGQLSYFKFLVPTGGAGNYTVRAGCFSNTSCGGTVAWKVTPRPPGTTGGSFNFNVTNTNFAQQNTANHSLDLTAGQVLKLGTCTVTGATGTGDTILRLFGPSATEVAMNDDTCDLLSYLAYTVPTTGTYQIRAGCYSSNTCSGTVAYTLE